MSPKEFKKEVEKFYAIIFNLTNKFLRKHGGEIYARDEAVTAEADGVSYYMLKFLSKEATGKLKKSYGTIMVNEGEGGIKENDRKTH